MEFHPSCLALDSVKIQKPGFVHTAAGRLSLNEERMLDNLQSQPQQTKVPWFVTVFQFVMQNQTYQTNNWSVVVQTARVGNFFHLSCLGYQRMPNNSKTTWRCAGFKKGHQSAPATTTCASPTVSSISIPSTSAVSTNVSSIESDDVLFVKETRAEIDNWCSC